MTVFASILLALIIGFLLGSFVSLAYVLHRGAQVSKAQDKQVEELFAALLEGGDDVKLTKIEPKKTKTRKKSETPRES